MAALHPSDKIAKGTLYQIGYDYLCNNFHKFKEANKIRVAIAILNIFEKDDSKTKQDIRQIVVMKDVTKNGEPVRYNLGQADTSGNIEDTGQARPDTHEAG